MTKELIIIALLILVIYLYSQQNQPNLSTDSSEIKQLQKQIEYYQKLSEEKETKLNLTQQELSKNEQIIKDLSQENQELTDKNTSFAGEKTQWNQERIELKKKLLEKSENHRQELNSLQKFLTVSQKVMIHSREEADYFKKLSLKQTEKLKKDQEIFSELNRNKNEDRKIIEINDVGTQADKEETEAKTKEPIEKEKEVKK